ARELDRSGREPRQLAHQLRRPGGPVDPDLRGRPGHGAGAGRRVPRRQDDADRAPLRLPGQHHAEPHRLAEDGRRSDRAAVGAVRGRRQELDAPLRGHLLPEEGLIMVEHAAASLTPDERALLALEDSVIDAIRRRDVSALAALVTEGFVLVGSDGTETRREEFLRAAVEVPGGILELSALHLRARAVGGVGVLTGLQRARVRLPTGIEVDDVAFFTDVCVRTGTGWKMALAHSGPAVLPGAPRSTRGSSSLLA